MNCRLCYNHSTLPREFEILDHTADVGITAYGADAKEVFANAGKALFSLITDPESVREVETREVEVEAPDQERLLVDWLNELIYYFDAENILFRRFEVSELSDTHLKARAYGERVDIKRHELKLGVKAATYHQLKIEKTDGGVRAQVIFDI